MSGSESSSSRLYVLIAAVAVVFLVAILWWFLTERASWSRGEALGVALASLIDKPKTDESLVARAILDNYVDAGNCLAVERGLLGIHLCGGGTQRTGWAHLKFESIVKDQAVKKDIAALFSVVAAMMITISTSGDFQRKWQANRIAAAELERIGYELLAKSGADSSISILGRTNHA